MKRKKCEAKRNPFNALTSRVSDLVAQFDVPVREIDKVFPEIVLRYRKCDLNERAPLRALRFAN